MRADGRRRHAPASAPTASGSSCASTGRHAVTVLGYQGEPYLRVSRARRVREPLVAGGRAEPDARPVRRRAERADRSAPLGTGLRRLDRPLARPPGALDGRRHARRRCGATRTGPHVIERWRIPLRVDGAAAPSPDAGARRDRGHGAVGPAARRRGCGSRSRRCSRSRCSPAAASRPGRCCSSRSRCSPAAESVHLWGSWPFSTADAGGRVGENLPSIAAVAATLARVRVARAPVRVLRRAAADHRRAVHRGRRRLRRPPRRCRTRGSRAGSTRRSRARSSRSRSASAPASRSRASLAAPGAATGHLTGWTDAHDLHPHHRRRAARARSCGATTCASRSSRSRRSGRATRSWCRAPRSTTGSTCRPTTNAHLIGVAHEIGAAQMDAFAPARIGLIIAGLEVPAHPPARGADRRRTRPLVRERRSRRHARVARRRGATACAPR